MVNQIKQWVSPPSFPDDETKTRRAEVVNIALLAVGSMGFFILLGNLVGGKTSWYVSFSDVFVILLALVLLWRLRHGEVTFVAVAFTILSFLAITAAAALLGTVRTPTTALYLVFVVGAGILFEKWGLWVSTVVASLSIMALIVAENAHLLPKPDTSVSITQWITYTTIIGLIGVMTYTSFRATRRALVRVDEELTVRRKLEQDLRASETLYQSLVETLPLSICRRDMQGRIVFANSRYCENYSLSPADIRGKTDFDLHPPALAEKYRAEDEQIARTGATLDRVDVYQPLNGASSFVHFLKTPLYDEQHTIIGIQVAFWDVTERVRDEERLRYLGTHDILTGLYNRTFYEAEMERLAHSQRFPLSIVLIDLDGLKPVNDTQGHAAGDELLRRAAEFLRACFQNENNLKGRENCIARIGGDEFAVLLPEVSEDAVAELVAAIKTQLAAQNGSTGTLSFSVGAATAETESDSLEKVEHEADAAMYRDKLSKLGRVERRKAQA